MRFALAVAVALGLGSIVVAGPSQAAIKRPTNIPAQSLGPALKNFAASRDLQILYFTDTVRNLRTRGAVGEITTDEALTRLLSGTGLTYKYLDDKTITVLPLPSGNGRTADSPRSTAKEVQNESFWDRFRLAQTSGPANPQTSGVSAAEESGTPTTVEEIVVTAQKRAERLHEVPIPMTATSADVLVRTNQLQLQDYYTKIPGLNLTTTGTYGGSVISIRGITSGVFNDGTVSVVVDDVPYGTTSAQGPGEVIPEIDLSELQRLEVLRGPQSTLYGASSLGGLVKYVTIDPSTDKFEGRLQGSLSSVRNGDEAGYSFRGAMNVPLGENLAVRASGFTRLDPGYIDVPAQSVEGINSERVSGGRLTLLWQFAPDFSLKLAALFEDSELDGASYVNLLPGQTQLIDLKQSTPPGSGGYRKKLQVYSANLTGQIGSANLTSVTAYARSDNTYKFDQTPTLGGLANSNFGVTGVAAVQKLDTEKFTEELRMSMPLGANVDWLLGAFYSNERTPQDDVITAVSFNTGAPAGLLGFLDLPSTYKEYAVFSDLTFKLTDRFDIQIGGRGSRNEQSLDQRNVGPLFVGGLQDFPKQFSDDRSFTYLFTPRFRVSSDLMVYARLASGYRPGGPNTNASLGVPAEFGPDRTQNYEIGVKGTAFNRVLSFDASVYHIDWKDVLLTLREPTIGASYKANAGKATSDGIDLAIELRPSAGLTVAAWGAWNVAEVSENFPATSTVRGLDGDRLPFSSRFSGNFSVDQELPLAGAWSALVGADLSYVGERRGVFTATGVRQVFPSYTKIDARIAVRSETWDFNFFVNNAADRRGVINGGAGNLYANTFAYIRPRTFGVLVTRTF